MAWSDGETRTYAYDGSDNAISETLDAGFEYTITVEGADGGDSTNADYKGGTGGYVEATYTATSSEDVEIYVGEAGPDSSDSGYLGGWGRFDGGNGDSGGFGGAGGGSTEILLSSPSNYSDSYLVVADAGGGAADLGDSGGGARCGLGDRGGDAECPTNVTGFGGDGNASGSGEDGGQAVSNGANLSSESKGGSTHPDGTDNGYVEITAVSLNVTTSGSVVEGGTAIQGATIEIINQNTQEVYTTTTDSSGNWSIDLPPDTYHFVARYEDAEGKKRTLSKPYISVS